MQKGTVALLGVILIIAAVLLVLIGHRVCQEAGAADIFNSISVGNQMCMVADIIKIGGYVTGFIGIVLFFAGLFMKSEN
ncbi:MAG: hypothetical protein ABFR63_11180 [Thermodesulfobacteriota bacterium]